MNMYDEMCRRHQREVNNFLNKYAFFAYDNNQFLKGLQKFGVSENDAHEVFYGTDHGCFVLKEKYNDFLALADRVYQERQDALHDPETGYQFAVDMFRSELANHEYSYTGELEETLDALGLTMAEVLQDKTLSKALLEAIQADALLGAVGADSGGGDE